MRRNWVDKAYCLILVYLDQQLLTWVESSRLQWVNAARGFSWASPLGQRSFCCVVFGPCFCCPAILPLQFPLESAMMKALPLLTMCLCASSLRESVGRHWWMRWSALDAANLMLIERQAGYDRRTLRCERACAFSPQVTQPVIIFIMQVWSRARSSIKGKKTGNSLLDRWQHCLCLLLLS